MSRLMLFLVGMCVLAQQADLPVRVGVSVLERKLSLAEAIEMALKNNLELDIERTNVAAAAQDILAARGFYDPHFLWTPYLESRATPVANTLAAPQGKLNEHFLNQNFSIRQPTQWNGMNLQVDFLNSRQSTSNPFTGLSPYWQTGLTVNLTQPLWRGRKIDEPRAQIVIATKQASALDADYEAKVIDIVTRTQTAYWDLVAALQDVQVEGEGVKLAQEQLARNQRMISSGTLAPVELAASEAELQRRVDTFAQAVGTVTIAENSLKMLVAPAREAEIWSDRIVPTESGQVEPESTELGPSMRVALDKRPEIRALGFRDEINTTQQTLAEDRTKPQFNLVAAYNNSGLGGTLLAISNPLAAISTAQIQRINELSALAGLQPLPNPNFGGIPPSLVGGYGTSISNMFSGNYQTVQAGIQIDWNMRNRTAQAQLAQTQIAERRLKLQRQQLLQGIEAEVRNSLQGVETARQRIQAARASERAAQEKLDSEVRLFQTGESTNFLVLTRQNEMLDSRRRAVQATLLFNKAVAVLSRATGTTLESNQITLK